MRLRLPACRIVGIGERRSGQVGRRVRRAWLSCQAVARPALRALLRVWPDGTGHQRHGGQKVVRVALDTTH